MLFSRKLLGRHESHPFAHGLVNPQSIAKKHRLTRYLPENFERWAENQCSCESLRTFDAYVVDANPENARRLTMPQTQFPLTKKIT